MRKFLTYLIFAWCFFSAGLSHALADLRAEAVLEPQQIPVNGVAQLVVTVSGASSAQVNVPAVDGLRYSYSGQESSYTMVNGEVNQKIVFYYQILATRPGNYTVPGAQVSEGGETVESQPLALQVTGGQGASQGTMYSAPQQQQQSSQPAYQPPTQRWAPRQEQDNNHQELVFLRVYAPKQTLYVGEVIPIQIKLFVQETTPTQVKSLPVLLGDAFVMNNLSRQPPEGEETVSGINYQTLTWNTSLSAVKTGDYPAEAQIDVTTIEQRQTGHGGIFDNPFFALFAAQARQVDKTFSSGTETWRVLPLPTEGKPEGFNGAIGNFQVSAQVDSKQVTVGEPLQIQWTVEGKGNFDRVNAPVATNSDGWKIYPASGKAELDEFGLQGRKIFTQSLIPQNANTVGLPQFTFSFFNPELHRYVTKEVQTTPVAIVPAPAGSTVTTTNSSANPSSSSDTGEGATTTSLVPNKVDLGSFAADLKFKLLNPWVVVDQLVSLAILAFAFVIERRRKLLQNNPAYARRLRANQKLKEALGGMRQAMDQDDGALFFTSAREALQQQLSVLLQIEPAKISYAVIEEKRPDLADSLYLVFHMADEFSYGGAVQLNRSLHEWDEAVKQELEKLEALK